MLLGRFRGRNRITLWRLVVVTVAMTMLLSGITLLFVYLASARGQKRGNLAYSRAELHHHQGSNLTVSEPFGREDASFLAKNGIHGNGNATGCPKFHFACSKSSACLELEKRCDGFVDCPGAEDELDCVCAFRMPPSKFCDKYPDCFDESDEQYCSYCPVGYFNCGDGKCIPRRLLCDSRVDCDNFMDENFCFRLSSDVDFADADGADPMDSTTSTTNNTLSKIGYLLRNKQGTWYPVCANPVDRMQDALASFACVSITANPLAGSTHQLKRFPRRNAAFDQNHNHAYSGEGFSRPTFKENFSVQRRAYREELAVQQRPAYKGDYIYHYRGRFIKWNGCSTDSGIFISCDDIRCGFNPKHLLPKKPRGRIVGGDPSEPGAWPWHGAVYKNASYACGATLISSKWLVSAAHCFIDYKTSYYEVQLGMLRRKSFTPHQKTLRIDRVALHDRFNVITLDFDIALLRMTEPVTFDFWIRPICLPDPKTTENSGSFCTAIGWGDTGETEDDSEDLLEVHVPLTQSCKKDSKRWLCAGYVEGGRDACQGDSGGPLMCLQRDGISWYIAGVISAGTGCARPDKPGMYTRVVHFLDWMQKVMINPNSVGQPLSTCPGRKCSAVGGGNCLKSDRVCDGHVDCYDAQDEANCFPETDFLLP